MFSKEGKEKEIVAFVDHTTNAYKLKKQKSENKPKEENIPVTRPRQDCLALGKSVSCKK